MHRLDYQDPAGQRIARHHRAPADVVVQCDQVLLAANDFVAQTPSLLR